MGRHDILILYIQMYCLPSPSDAMHYAFKRLDADISLEAQVPLSNDLMKSTAIQVILQLLKNYYYFFLRRVDTVFPASHVLYGHSVLYSSPSSIYFIKTAVIPIAIFPPQIANV